jgi:hypothetical protein
MAATIARPIGITAGVKAIPSPSDEVAPAAGASDVSESACCSVSLIILRGSPVWQELTLSAADVDDSVADATSVLPALVASPVAAVLPPVDVVLAAASPAALDVALAATGVASKSHDSAAALTLSP